MKKAKNSSISDLEEKAKLIRKLSLVSTTSAGSGHPTSCLSAADITTVLFNNYFTFDLAHPDNPNNDRFILSKGHAAPLLYSLFAVSGAIPFEKLNTLRKITSPLEGHPTPAFPFSEAATGSLGQGLSIGAGEAFALRAQIKNSSIRQAQDIIQNSPKVYVLLGDGEMAEGSVWEAANFASFYKLSNLIAIVDVNKYGQSQETMFGHHLEAYVNRFKAFGWEVIKIDGHNLVQIKKALDRAVHNKSKKPFAIIAKTKKGKGISFLEDKDGWHGKPVKKEELQKALEELGKVDENLRFNLRIPKERGPVTPFLPASARSTGPYASQTPIALRAVGSPSRSATPSVQYKIGDEVATREVYGQVLAQLGNTNPFIYSLDAEVKNSTYAMDFLKVHPDRFIECFIAEQNMVGVGIGLSNLGKIPFVSTFAAFLTRAFDQIRMGAVGGANIKFVGSHAGVSIGEDGPSQMGLEDVAMFRTIPDSVVLHTCDGVSTTKLLPQMVNHNGISYLRTLRPKTPVIYNPNEEFEIGGLKVLRQSKDDKLLIVASGITVFEALKAYEELKQQGVHVRVIDLYSIKPLDKESLIKNAKETKFNYVITVEDHYENGGMGDAVASALSLSLLKIDKMAVTAISHSGTKDELLDLAGIDTAHIVKKVKTIDK